MTGDLLAARLRDQMAQRHPRPPRELPDIEPWHRVIAPGPHPANLAMLELLLATGQVR